jgi:hypothetical protein
MGDSNFTPQNAGRDVVISFDDLYENDKPTGPLPTGYAGCTWCENSWFLTKGCYSWACMRGQVALLNANGHDISFRREDPFHLKSVLLSSLWKESADVVLEGWAQGARKYSQTLTARKLTATQFGLDYEDIDRVNLNTGGAHVVVSNFTLHLP